MREPLPLASGCVRNTLDKAKPLAIEQHVLCELAPACKICSVRLLPEREAPIALPLVVSERCVHFTKSVLGEFH